MKLHEKEEDFFYEWFTFLWSLDCSLVYFALIFGKIFSCNQENMALYLNLF